MKATSVKVKFRTSTAEGKEGKVYYQVIHRRVARQIKTCYKLFPCEWVTQYPYVSIYNAGTRRREYLQTVKHRIAEDINILHNLITVLERTKNTYTADELVLSFHKAEKDFYLFEFMKSVIANMKSLNRHSIGENYISTLNSFSRFRNGADITLNEPDQSIILEYESYLKVSGVCPNTSSFYMRNLRAVYNRAVERRYHHTDISLQACIYGHRENGQTRCDTEHNKEDKKHESFSRTVARICERHVHVQLLHPWNVIHRHGLSQKDKPARRYSDIQKEEDRTAAEHKMGELHAGNNREIRDREQQIHAADNQRT